MDTLMKWLEREQRHLESNCGDYEVFLAWCHNDSERKILKKWLKFGIKPALKECDNFDDLDDMRAPMYVDAVIANIRLDYIPIVKRKCLDYYLSLCRSDTETDVILEWLKTRNDGIIQSGSFYNSFRVSKITDLLKKYYL